MKPKLYLETTIPSYLTAWPSRDLIMAAHQRITQAWWQKRRDDFAIYLSAFVLTEAGAGDPEASQRRLKVLEPFPLLAVDERVAVLAARLLKDCRLPSNAATDAAHVAVAAVHGMEFFLTWNCTHLANAEFVPKVRGVCEAANYASPVICTPEELMGM